MAPVTPDKMVIWWGALCGRNATVLEWARIAMFKVIIMIAPPVPTPGILPPRRTYTY